MADYQKMYYILCHAASDALDKLPETKDTQKARQILQRALLEAEEVYISDSVSDEETQLPAT